MKLSNVHSALYLKLDLTDFNHGITRYMLSWRYDYHEYLAFYEVVPSCIKSFHVASFGVETDT